MLSILEIIFISTIVENTVIVYTSSDKMLVSFDIDSVQKGVFRYI